MILLKLDENGGKDIKIITKVENVEGLSNMEDIIKAADAQMIARGDMATETDFTEPPVMQKKFIKLSNRANKPAITATQMLESMMSNPLPTRAEASDVANAIYDRTSAIMQSYVIHIQEILQDVYQEWELLVQYLQLQIIKELSVN